METTKLMDAKIRTTHTTSTSTETRKSNKPPKGAKIIEETERTEVEEIENGFLLVKNHYGRYKEKESDDDYGRHFDYSKKWFSKTNPMKVNIKAIPLADKFEE